MKEGIISFKFRSEKEFDSIKFYGEAISLGDVKRMIEEKRIKYKEIEGGKKRESYELLMYDANNRKKESELIQSNTFVIVQRVPKNATDYILNFSSEAELTFLPQEKGESIASINLAKANPNVMKKGFNDIPTSFQPGIFKIPQNPTNVPYGTTAQYKKAMGYLRGASVPARYSEKEIMHMIQNARYFIIKSANQDNINLSRIYNEWATTRNNEAKLNEAFHNAPYVILLFSVNKSSHFQGFALMKSLITNKIAYYWKNNGGCFRVEWITTAFLSFSRLHNYYNPLNHNESITKSRDGQELPQHIGRDVCLMFQIPKVKEDPNKLLGDNDSTSSEEFFEAKRAKKELKMSLDKKENSNNPQISVQGQNLLASIVPLSNQMNPLNPMTNMMQAKPPPIQSGDIVSANLAALASLKNMKPVSNFNRPQGNKGLNFQNQPRIHQNKNFQNFNQQWNQFGQKQQGGMNFGQGGGGGSFYPNFSKLIGNNKKPGMNIVSTKIRRGEKDGERKRKKKKRRSGSGERRSRSRSKSKSRWRSKSRYKRKKGKRRSRED